MRVGIIRSGWGYKLQHREGGGMLIRGNNSSKEPE